jgi:hypothetical protein
MSSCPDSASRASKGRKIRRLQGFGRERLLHVVATSVVCLRHLIAAVRKTIPPGMGLTEKRNLARTLHTALPWYPLRCRRSARQAGLIQLEGMGRIARRLTRKLDIR